MLLSLTLTIGWWIIPVILTLICLSRMLRQSEEDWGIFFGFAALFRLFWLIPILFIWLIYFAIMYYIK